MKKRRFYTELCYVGGLLAMALGTALMEKADFGMSMVVAPAYLIYRKVSQSLSFFTFGMAEYTFQAVLLLAMMIFLRRFRVSYLFSFVTAVLYGVVLDGWTLLLGGLPGEGAVLRAAYFAVGMPLCSLGVAFFFHTYIAPEVYELIVMEISKKWNLDSSRCKTAYDCVSCAVSIGMSFLFFGPFRFVGVNVGTVLCALLNGKIIGVFGRMMEQRMEFRDGLPRLKAFFS